MFETFALYQSKSHSYQEYAIVFWEVPKQSDITCSKVIHIWETYPKYVVTLEWKSLELPRDLPKLSGLKEIVFQIEWTKIVRISVRDFVSEIPDTQHKTTQAVENSISSK